MCINHTDVGSEAIIGGTISQGVIKFYSTPFFANGTTLKLTVTTGIMNCYASDRFRNPNQYEYDWTVEIRDYWEIYIDPLMLLRPVESILYVSFLGLNISSTYQVNISSGNTLTVGELYLDVFTMHGTSHNVVPSHMLLHSNVEEYCK